MKNTVYSPNGRRTPTYLFFGGTKMDMRSILTVLFLSGCVLCITPFIIYKLNERKKRKTFIEYFGYDPLAINPQLKNALTNTINEVLVKLAKERHGVEEGQRIFLEDAASSSSKPYSKSLEICRIRLEKAVLDEETKYYEAYNAAKYFNYKAYTYKTALKNLKKR